MQVCLQLSRLRERPQQPLRQPMSVGHVRPNLAFPHLRRYDRLSCGLGLSTACTDCDTTCLTCNGPSTTDCTTCDEGRYLSSGSCLTECPDGFFERESDNTCQGKPERGSTVLVAHPSAQHATNRATLALAHQPPARAATSPRSWRTVPAQPVAAWASSSDSWTEPVRVRVAPAGRTGLTSLGRLRRNLLHLSR